MGIRKYKPTTPGLRGMTVSTFEEITTDKPEKSLTVTLKKHSGRNVRGKITVRHRGGGYRPKYRIIDFKRNKDDIPATVKTIEYDPNRTANIALVVYADGEKRYIIAPNKLKVGDVIESGPNARRYQAGQCTPDRKYSSRYYHSQHRAQAWQGRSARKSSRKRSSAHG